MRISTLAHLTNLASGSETRRVNGMVNNEQKQELRYMTADKQKLFLTKIFKKIDSDKNGKIDREECVRWIQKIEHQHIGTF